MQNLSIRAPLLIVASFSSMVIASQSHRRRRSNRREHGNHQSCSHSALISPTRIKTSTACASPADLRGCVCSQPVWHAQRHRPGAWLRPCSTCAGKKTAECRNLYETRCGVAYWGRPRRRPGLARGGDSATRARSSIMVRHCGRVGHTGLEARARAGQTPRTYAFLPRARRNGMGRIAWHDSWGAGTFSSSKALLYLGEFASGKGAFPTRSDIVPLLRPQMNQGYKPTHSFPPKVGGGIAL